MGIGTYAQFTSITPNNIIGARPDNVSPHKFTLNWTYPTISNYQITKIEIFRYITNITEGISTFPFNDLYRIAIITNNILNTT